MTFWQILFTAQLEEIGFTEILNILEDCGGWPVLKGSAWDESSYDWKQNIYKFRKHGISIDYMIRLTVELDLKNTKVRMLQVSIL